MKFQYGKWIAIVLALLMVVSVLFSMPNASATLNPGWTKVKVFDVSGSSYIEDTSIALNSEGHVVLAYGYNPSGYSFKLYIATNESGSWVNQLVDGDPNVGLMNSMVIDSGDHIHIAYFDYERYCVKYATNKSGSWVNETVKDSSLGDYGQLGIAIALATDGTPIIAYNNVTSGDNSVCIAKKDGGIWKEETIDIDSSGGQIGVGISYSIDQDGDSHLSYVRNHKLGYATNEGGSWYITNLDTTYDAGWGSSLAIDGSGHIGISYRVTSFDPDRLMYITNAGGSWVAETVSSNLQDESKLAFGPGGVPNILSNQGGAMILFTKNGASWDYIWPTDDGYTSQASLCMNAIGKMHISYVAADLYYLTDSISSDTTAPSISITSPTSGSTYSTTMDHVTVGGSCSDDVGVSSITWSNSLGGSGSISVGTTWSSSIPLFSGSNVITVTAYDAAGHSTTATITVTYTPDTTNPSVTIQVPDPGSTFNTYTGAISAGSISGTASDNVGITSMSITNGANSATTGVTTSNSYSTWASSSNLALNPGTNIIQVKAMDGAGNIGTATLTVNYITDATGPTVSIDSVSNGAIIKSTTLVVDWSGSDSSGIKGFQYRLDSGGWSVLSMDDGHTFEGLTEGGHSISVKCFDNYDNANTVTVSFIVDMTPPTISTVSPVNGALTNSTEISWTGNDGGSGISYYVVRVDNGTWSDHLTTPRYKFTGLVDGPHWVQIWAYDRADRVVERAFSFILDTTPPQFVISSPTMDDAYETNSSMVTISGTILDNSDIKEIVWSNDKSGSGAVTLTDEGLLILTITLAKGTNTISIMATDDANNTATLTLSVVYTPDEKDDPGLDVGMMAIIIALIVIAVLIATYLVWRKKRK